MSREKVELVLSLYDAVVRRDYESPLELLDEEIVWDMTGLGMPDLAKVYRGHDGIREFWRGWLGAWEMLEYKALTPTEHGDHVIVEVEQRNRGRLSGAAVDFHYFQTFTIRDGKVVASSTAETWTRAVNALGLGQ
jgi:ketosteroid isomerase-like protein